MEIVKIKAQPKKGSGKKAAKAVRAAGLVPCVMYGGEDNYTFSVDPHDFKELVYTPDFHMAEVEIDGKNIRCILKDVQFHPVSDEILHADFLELMENRRVKVEIPIHLKGTPEGVKSGGILQQTARKVTIKGKPKDLVDDLVVNVSHLEMHDAVRVRDIELPEGLEVLNSPGLPLASIVVPRMLRSAATAEAKEGLEGDELLAGAEGEATAEGAEGAEGPEGRDE